MIAAAEFGPRLVAWQRTHGRHDLPWQRDRDPYRVWLSEIMLQQTQVATVLRYFDRFVERFPEVRALAAAELDEVLALWSGLGYYRRARHLHQCARQVVERHGGEFPRDALALQALSGIGRSTAAAIAAFSFGERAAILDGNVKRVLRRAFAPALHEHATGSGAELRELWALAQALLPRDGIDAYTQGLMDLGATVCRARRPDCDACPFAGDCPSRGAAAAPSMPRRTRTQASWVLLWAHDAATPRVWLERRPASGIWPGLWCLPTHDGTGAALRQASELGRVDAHTALPARRHLLTHVELELHPLRVALTPRPRAADAAGGWFTLPEALALGLPAPVRRLLAAHATREPG
ncbi:A/G-specific adenine glycosylase [mine drainage metagenome]|uniref:Adenine DNA glycosylase n=1 Tax=mine drainage metagenome TaxID=410659 RepID=A0A1J5PY82_9ZZZZ